MSKAPLKFLGVVYLTEVTRLDGEYKIEGLAGDEEELTISVHNGSVPFTFRELEDVVGRPVTVNGIYGAWRVIAAVHTEGGWGARVTFERVPLDEARELALLGLKPKTLEDRVADLEELGEKLVLANQRLDRRLDATINIAAREAIEHIRKKLAAAVGLRW